MVGGGGHSCLISCLYMVSVEFSRQSFMQEVVQWEAYIDIAYIDGLHV